MPGLENSFTKKALYFAGGVILVYLMIYFLTPKPVMPVEYQEAIDSLTKANEVLMNNQKQLDNAINHYQTKVEELDSAIHVIKEKTTIVKEFHHEVIERVKHYDATQVDSFFKTRYNY